MVLPALKQSIYGFCVHEPADHAVMECLMNIMQPLFIVLRSVSTLDEDTYSKAQQVFFSLCTKHIYSEMV